MCALVLGLSPLARAASRAAQVTYLSGHATLWGPGRHRGRALHRGSVVHEHDQVETGANTRVELTTSDGSVVRVGPETKLLLKSAYFGSSGVKRFSVKLLFGRLWSKVRGLVGSRSKFEVVTDNAVAGVRGTTFRVDARKDKSVVLKVYAGSVAMASPMIVRPHVPSAPGGRHQVSGPSRISAQAWEKLVGRMMELTVNADGSAGEPKPFTAKDDAGDAWAQWNQRMDAKESRQ